MSRGQPATAPGRPWRGPRILPVTARSGRWVAARLRMAKTVAGFSPAQRPFPAKNYQHSFPNPAGMLQVPSSPASVMDGQPGQCRFPPQSNLVPTSKATWRDSGARAPDRHFHLPAMNRGRPAVSTLAPGSLGSGRLRCYRTGIGAGEGGGNTEGNCHCLPPDGCPSGSACIGSHHGQD